MPSRAMAFELFMALIALFTCSSVIAYSSFFSSDAFLLTNRVSLFVLWGQLLTMKRFSLLAIFLESAISFPSKTIFRSLVFLPLMVFIDPPKSNR